MNQSNQTLPVVNSHNEWDLLEEVIVGRIDGAAVPHSEPCLDVDVPPKYRDFFDKHAGRHFPEDLVKAASKELEEFCCVLQAEGVKVKRPDVIDFSQPYKTPDFEASGLYAAMPRDILIVIGNEIIEAPMAWRSRFFEYRAYRSLMKDYLKQGSKWTTAPKPLMSDELYDFEFVAKPPKHREALVTEGRYATTEFEPCFDAADLVRFGRDIFVQRSHVTNDMGIRWLRTHLGKEYRVHTVKFMDVNPMHIDASLVPLKPGIALINPSRPPCNPELFKKAGWDLIETALPATPDTWNLPIASKWVSMNLLMLDTERVVVERQEEPTQKLLRDLGFKVITVDFRNVYTFGGSFHCTTCDVRRNSKLEEYGFSNVVSC